MEERGVGLAGQDSHQRGGSQPERRSAEGAVEGQRVERLRTGEHRDVRSGAQATRLKVRQQGRVLFGRLGDPIDRRPLAGLGLRERLAGRPASGDLGIDRVAVRARLRVPEQVVKLLLDARRDGCLQPLRFRVRLRPAEPDDLGEQPLAQGVAPEDAVGRCAAIVSWSSRPSASETRPSLARRRNISLAACVLTPSFRATCEAVIREPSPAMIRSVSRYSWAELERSFVARCRSVPGPPSPPDRLKAPAPIFDGGARRTRPSPRLQPTTARAARPSRALPAARRRRPGRAGKR